MGDIAHHIHAGDRLAAQEGERIGVGLLEERNHQVRDIHFVFFGALAVVEGMLDHSMEGEGLERID